MDRVVAAVRQYVLQPDEEITNRRDWPGAVTFSTTRFAVEAKPADWLIGQEPWVDEAVRVVADGAIENFAFTYGFAFTRTGEVLFLNEMATMRELGRRVGTDLDPLAYAELLSELYSGKIVDQPVVLANAAMSWFRAGELIRDVDAFVASYPWAAPVPVAPPAFLGDTIVFYSCHYYLTGQRALDVLRWRVEVGSGQWEREYVAEGLEHL